MKNQQQKQGSISFLAAAFQGHTEEESKGHGLETVSKQFRQQLIKDNIDVELIKEEADNLVDPENIEAVTCQEKLLHFLHRLPFEICIIALISLDVIIVLSVMIIDVYLADEILAEYENMTIVIIQYLQLVNNSHGCHAVNPNVLKHPLNVTATYNAVRRVLYENATSSSESSNYSIVNLQTPEASVHTASEILTHANHVLHFIGMSILIILVLEVVLRAIGNGRKMFHSKTEVIDAVVNVASLIIDILITEHSVLGAVGKVLIVLALLWRVVRILNAIIMASKAKSNFRIKVLKKTKTALETKLLDMEKKYLNSNTEAVRLRELAVMYGATPNEITAFTKPVADVVSTRYGIQASLMHLVHFNNAITGRQLRSSVGTELLEEQSTIKENSTDPNVGSLDECSSSKTSGVFESSQSSDNISRPTFSRLSVGSLDECSSSKTSGLFESSQSSGNISRPAFYRLRSLSERLHVHLAESSDEALRHKCKNNGSCSHNPGDSAKVSPWYQMVRIQSWPNILQQGQNSASKLLYFHGDIAMGNNVGPIKSQAYNPYLREEDVSSQSEENTAL